MWVDVAKGAMQSYFWVMAISLPVPSENRAPVVKVIFGDEDDLRVDVYCRCLIIEVFKGSIIQGFNYSRVQLFKGSIIQGFNYSRVQLFKCSGIQLYKYTSISICIQVFISSSTALRLRDPPHRTRPSINHRRILGGGALMSRVRKSRPR
jgi:hypothetical protein